MESKYGFTKDVISNICIEIARNCVGHDWLEKKGHPMNPTSQLKCPTPDNFPLCLEKFISSRVGATYLSHLQPKNIMFFIRNTCA